MSFIMTTLKDKDGNPIRDEYGNAVYDSPRLIITGQKTQTRRIRKDHERLEMRDGLKTVVSYSNPDKYPSGRIKWQVGRDYAVKPKRSMPAVWYQLRDIAQKLMDENHGADIELAHVDKVNPNSKETWLEHFVQGYDGFCKEVEQDLVGCGFRQLRVRVTDLAPQILSHVTNEDAIAEGIAQSTTGLCWNYQSGDWEIIYPHSSYKTLLEATNGGKTVSWDLPVWKIDFELVEDDNDE